MILDFGRKRDINSTLCYYFLHLCGICVCSFRKFFYQRVRVTADVLEQEMQLSGEIVILTLMSSDKVPVFLCLPYQEMAHFTLKA